MNAGVGLTLGRAQATQMIGACSEAPRPKSGRGRRKPQLAPWQESLAKRLIYRQLAYSVNVADIAAICRLSVSYFERAFANSVGLAPYAWLLEQRVAHAKSLLADPTRPIAHIALDCGFVDQAHFTNTFSRKVGVTPGKWRNENLSARL